VLGRFRFEPEPLLLEITITRDTILAGLGISLSGVSLFSPIQEMILKKKSVITM